MNDVKVIAAYLPQYHEIPENSKWWGEGYTDWVAVKKSKPLYEGHNQPRVPYEQNYYDLSNPEAIRWQARLARKYGVFGFGIYHYWFSDEQQLLTKPAEIILENKDIDIGYCFIWDNNSWVNKTWKNVKFTNQWAPQFEGNEYSSGVLAELKYGDEKSWKKHYDYLKGFFADSRYIKDNGKPIFGIFQPTNNRDVLLKMCNYIAKTKGLQFKLYFNHPFPLEDFFIPNLHDWRIDTKQICRDYKKVDVIVLDNTQDSYYQIKKQKRYLEKMIKVNGKQKHVYTNSSFSYGLDYSGLFNELFRPSERLQKGIDKQLSLISSRYISVSCRFLDLLGDFNETYGYGQALSERERESLLQNIDNVIEKLHSENPDKKILVNSDSVTFLNKYKGRDFAYVIEGNVTHIDAKQGDYAYENYEKTFLDFMMIANAEKIYLIKSDLMFKSGYPYAASKIYKKEFEIIEI